MSSVVKLQVEPRLKEVMSKAHVSQKELSRRTGISQSSLSRFDDQVSHKDEHIFLIAEALGCPIESLFSIKRGGIGDVCN